MRRTILIILVMGLLLASAGAVLAQGDGEADPPPACTEDDLRPVAAIMMDMLDAMNRGGRFAVEEMLTWRAQISDLPALDCAEYADILTQLYLANDELLIGALLLERGNPDDVETGALAINIGLTNLVGLRAYFADMPADLVPLTANTEPFGSLDADVILAAFTAADLPIADVVRDAGPAGGNAPSTEAERITFALPTVFDGGVGQLLIFDTVEARDAWAAYLAAPGTLNAGQVIVYRNVIVQLSDGLDESTLRRFEDVLRAFE